MLAHMKSMMSEAPQNDDTNRCLKPSTFHEMYGKTAINLEGLTRIISKANLTAVSG